MTKPRTEPFYTTPLSLPEYIEVAGQAWDRRREAERKARLLDGPPWPSKGETVRQFEARMTDGTARTGRPPRPKNRRA